MRVSGFNRESSIEKKVCDKAELEFGVPNLKMAKTGKRGDPDRLFLIPGGKPLFIEFKAPGKEPTLLQAHRHKLLKVLGYDIETHDTVYGALRAITRAVEAARVSKESGPVHARQAPQRAIPRPRTWED
jgi:hypothetical protein